MTQGETSANRFSPGTVLEKDAVHGPGAAARSPSGRLSLASFSCGTWQVGLLHGAAATYDCMGGRGEKIQGLRLV